MEIWLQENERIDNIGFGNLRLIQKPEDFCYGIDAVILASFAEIKKDSKVADLGTGTCIIPIILSHKTKASEIIGIELQEDSYQRGIRNIFLNNLENRIKLLNCDVKDIVNDQIQKDQANSFQSLLPQSFDTVISNPPYMKGNGGLKNDKDAKTIARHETTAALSDFIKTAGYLLKDRGEFYMVHRPNRLVDICVLCRNNKLEPKKIKLVSANKNSKPNILLIHCVKNGKPELKFLDPLYVYNEMGEYTHEIMEIYERK